MQKKKKTWNEMKPILINSKFWNHEKIWIQNPTFTPNLKILQNKQRNETMKQWNKNWKNLFGLGWFGSGFGLDLFEFEFNSNFDLIEFNF